MKKVWYLVLLMLVLGCAPSNKEGKKPSVLVTLSPYDTFVKKIAGETVDIHTLVPPGSNPHNFTPTSRQLEKTVDVTIWFTMGEPSEEKVQTLFQSLLPSIAIINLCQSITLLSNEEGIDHHVWLNPKLAKVQAKLIAESLKKYFPQHRFVYEKNLSLFLLELDQLDKDITKLLKPYQGKAILVSHPSFGYFCEAYGLRQISVEAGEKDPLAKTLQTLLETVKKEQISVAFIQPQHNNTAIEYIAHLLQIPTIVVDPYSSDYEKNLKHIAQLIANDGSR